MIMTAILPLFPAYLLYHFFQKQMASLSYLGFFLLGSSALLFITANKNFKPKKSTPFKDALYIGMMQALALVPGFSRSAATISGACMRGWEVEEAISFSFLLAIPTILGGQFLETLKLLFFNPPAAASLSLTSYFTGFISSLGVGLLSIRYLFSITDKKRMRPFAWYCLIIGSAAIALYYR